ncbi:hypothetical protein PILCRDRAFT_14869 [Piloderma croceum F 1598]|uniref:Uncharacterized protein n=1 Tax=Piloderma croceum (strain F 1598) TaxID=765440 RepID=A0A0C3EMQ5_PILCF|nr:hypothetical protein PILCRDRAFT_14869 [Piloderma croceum F 1598]
MSTERPKRRKKLKATSTAIRFELDPDDLLKDVALAQYISISSDGRRIYRHTEEFAAPPIHNYLYPIDETNLEVDNDWAYDGLIEDEKDKEGPTDTVNKRRVRRYLSSVSIVDFFCNGKM